jgi:hypothetical protein
MPKSEVEKLIEDIEQGVLSTLDAVNVRLRKHYSRYKQYELTWVMDQICSKKHMSFDQMSISDVLYIIEHWIEAVTQLDQMRCRDAEKEFAATAKVGYGLGGSVEDREYEYSVIHGSASDNEFILDMQRRLALKQKTAADLIERLQRL